MIGLDVASGVAGLLTLSISCLQGCIKGYTLLCRAKSYGRDVAGVRLMIELERHKLQTWAEEAGLFDQPPRLLVRRPDAQFVKDILAHLEETLLDVHKLKAKYGLDIVETGEEIRDLDEDDSIVSQLAPRQHVRLSELFQSKTRPWRKLTWITVDERNVRRLLDDVKGFVTELERFLEHSRQVKLDHAFNAMLRATVGKSANERELSVLGHGRSESFSIGAIPAAARWRRQGLLLGVLNTDVKDTSLAQTDVYQTMRETRSSFRVSPSAPRSPLLSNSGRSMRLTSTKLTLPSSTTKATRQFAWFEGDSGVLEPVLLEWKTGRGSIKLRDLENRVDKVSAFLHEMEPSFHSLTCRGYIKDWASAEHTHRYGYIFNLPFSPYPQTAQQSAVLRHMDRPPLPQMHTLRDLLDRHVEAPALNLRFHIAITLLETLLQLHTAGWLHKELRSDNLLFIQHPPFDQEVDGAILQSSVYVAGYVYARLDNPHEMTEPVESGSENDLYRHPLSMGNSRRSYRKAFDVFSIGCILLELGLWLSFPDILRSRSSSVLRRRDSHQDESFTSARQSWSFRESTSTLGSPGPRISSHSITEPSSKGVQIRRSSELRSRNSIHSIEEDLGQDSSGIAFDLLELRHQLLLSNLGTDNSRAIDSKQEGQTRTPFKDVLKALEGAAGTSYARIVQRFLLVVEDLEDMEDSSGTVSGTDEHAYALRLEMESLDTLRAIAKVL